GCRLVNSVQRLREIKAFVRMTSRLNSWGTRGMPELLAPNTGVVRKPNGEPHFAELTWRSNVIIRTDGRNIAPSFPTYGDFDEGNIDHSDAPPGDLSPIVVSTPRGRGCESRSATGRSAHSPPWQSTKRDQRTGPAVATIPSRHKFRSGYP